MDMWYLVKIVVLLLEILLKLSDKYKSFWKMLKRLFFFLYRFLKLKDVLDGGRGVCRSMSFGEWFVFKEEIVEMWGVNIIVRSDKGCVYIEDWKLVEKLLSSLDFIIIVEELYCKRLSCDLNNNVNLNVNGFFNNIMFFEKLFVYLKKCELGYFELEI